MAEHHGEARLGEARLGMAEHHGPWTTLLGRQERHGEALLGCLAGSSFFEWDRLHTFPHV